MDHPFIAPSELTDDELHEKIQKCTTIVYQETHWGHTQMVDSARQALEVYQVELEERIFRRLHDQEVAKNPDGIIEIGKIEGEVKDYDEVENKSAEVIVKQHRDL
jgi:hypothetical protein